MEIERLPQWLEDPPRPFPDDDESERMRARVSAGLGAPGRTAQARTWALAGAGVAAAMVVGLVLLPQGETGVAVAATPALLPHQVAEVGAEADLDSYVSRVASLPAVATYRDGEHHVVTQSWSLFTRVDGQQVDSAVVPERRELSWRADGSGELDVVTESPVFPSAAYRRVWEAEGSPAAEPVVVSRRRFAPGEYDPSFPSSLPSQPGALMSLLEAGHPIDELGTAELFVAVADLYREQTPEPAVRAALLALIDRAGDVDDLGDVQDRRGRPGRALAVDSDYSGLDTRYILTFDAEDGSLLSYEQVLTGDVGKLDVPSPAVISYELFDQETAH